LLACGRSNSTLRRIQRRAGRSALVQIRTDGRRNLRSVWRDMARAIPRGSNRMCRRQKKIPTACTARLKTGRLACPSQSAPCQNGQSGVPDDGGRQSAEMVNSDGNSRAHAFYSPDGDAPDKNKKWSFLRIFFPHPDGGNLLTKMPAIPAATITKWDRTPPWRSLMAVVKGCGVNISVDRGIPGPRYLPFAQIYQSPSTTRSLLFNAQRQDGSLARPQQTASSSAAVWAQNPARGSAPGGGGESGFAMPEPVANNIILVYGKKVRSASWPRNPTRCAHTPGPREVRGRH